MSSVLGTWKLHNHNVTTNHLLDTSVDLNVTKSGNTWTFSFKTTDGDQSLTTNDASPVTEFNIDSGTTKLKGKLFESALSEVIIGFVYKGTLTFGRERGGATITDADVFIATRTGQ